MPIGNKLQNNGRCLYSWYNDEELRITYRSIIFKNEFKF